MIKILIYPHGVDDRPPPPRRIFLVPRLCLEMIIWNQGDLNGTPCTSRKRYIWCFTTTGPQSKSNWQEQSKCWSGILPWPLFYSVPWHLCPRTTSSGAKNTCVSTVAAGDKAIWQGVEAYLDKLGKDMHVDQWWPTRGTRATIVYFYSYVVWSPSSQVKWGAGK